MSSYVFPATGGLKVTHTNGVQYGVWMHESPIGPVLIAARYDANQGWLAFWTKGPDLATAFQQEINTVGGIIAWLKSLLPAINAAFAKLFAPPAPLPTAEDKVFTVGNVNAALAGSFTLTSGPNGVVLLVK